MSSTVFIFFLNMKPYVLLGWAGLSKQDENKCLLLYMINKYRE